MKNLLSRLHGLYLEVCRAAARVDRQFALPWEPSHHEVFFAAIADPDNADAVIDRAHFRAT
jgi:hypothetical protein